MAGSREQVFVAQPIAYAGQRVIASPFQFATTEDDNLQIVSANSKAGVVLAIQGRRVTTAGAIEPFVFVHTPNGDRSTKTENFKLGAGALLNLVIFASSGAPVIGQTYVSARIIRGLSSATIVLGALLGGYVTANQPLAYPGSPIEHSLQPQWIARTIQGTDPAAGVEIAEQLPTGARWDLLAVTARLVTDATAGNRFAVLQVELSSPTPPIQCTTTAVLAPSSSWDLCWAQNHLYNAVSPSGAMHAPLPSPMLLVGGGNFKTVTFSMAAGDNWSAPIYLVREWLDL